MAILEENSNVSQPGQPSAENQKARFWSFNQQNLLNSPVAAGIGGEYFTKFRGILADICKNVAEEMDVSIIALNRQNQPNLRFSVLAVAARLKKLDPNTVSFYTLILEATGQKLNKVTRTLDNMQVEINRVTSDAYDEVLFKAVSDAVQAQYPTAHVYPSDALVVPARVSPDEKGKDVIENIARTALLADYSVITSVTKNFGELNLAYMEPDVKLGINVAFGNHHVTDILGAPHRSSVLINVSSERKGINPNSLDIVNVADSSVTVCELSGFVNQIWAPLNPTSGFGFPAYPNQQQQVGINQAFAAEFVITNVRSDFATSPAAILLAISSFYSLSDNNNWIQALLPRQSSNSPRLSSGQVDITNIGALNVTANIMGDTDREGFGREIDISKIGDDVRKISQYITRIFRPGIIISIDCPEAGPQSWYLSLFSAAAAGDSEAYNLLYQAANELTNGHFSTHFKHGEQMFSNIVRVPLGYYPVGESIQDIRNIDYVAIANLYKNTDPKMIHEYSNTFVQRPGFHEQRNLKIREDIINAALNYTAVITGYAARVSLSDKMTTALSRAIADNKVAIGVNTPLNADQLRAGVAVPSFVGNSLAQTSGTFAQSYKPMQQAQYRYTGLRRGF